MQYSKEFIEKLLHHFIKITKNTDNFLQIISFQALNSQVVLNAIRERKKGKLCYLLPSEHFYHALVITYEDRKIAYQYVLSHQEKKLKAIPLQGNILTRFKKELETTYDQSFEDKKFNDCIMKMTTATTAVAFTEALRQLLISEERTSLILTTVLANDLRFFIAHSGKKDAIRYLARVPDKTLLAFTSKLSSIEEIPNRLDELQKNIPSKPTSQQELIKILTVLYHTSRISFYSELAICLPIIFLPLLNDREKIANNSTIIQILKAAGTITGIYLFINEGVYSAIKPPITYFSSQLAMQYFNTGNVINETGDVISSYLNGSLDSSDWYLLVSNLFLLAEAFTSEDPRSPVYTISLIAANLLFIQLAKWFLPVFKNDHTRMALLMLVSLGSRLFSNTIVGHLYEKSDEQVLCVEAKDQLTAAIQGQTTALEIECRTSTLPFWRTPPTLGVLATNTKGKSYVIECDVHPGEQKFSNCEVEQEYHSRLLN